MQIDGSAALVVGGASGLGEAAARALHARGAHVVVADLDAARGEALAAELGERATFAAADVTQPEQLEAAVALAAAQTPGGLRIAINCAGIGHAERLARPRGPHAAATFERVVAINLVGTFHALRLAGAAMLANDPDDGRPASAASSSSPPRSPPTTGRSARSPTPPRRAASSR